MSARRFAALLSSLAARSSRAPMVHAAQARTATVIDATRRCATALDTFCARRSFFADEVIAALLPDLEEFDAVFVVIVFVVEVSSSDVLPKALNATPPPPPPDPPEVEDIRLDLLRCCC